MDPIVKKIYLAIEDGDVAAVSGLISNNPNYLEYEGAGMPSWLHDAARWGHIELVKYLIDVGLDLNKPGRDSVLQSALDGEHSTIVDYLLKQGANPAPNRELLGAIQIQGEIGLDLLKSLVDYGADVNKQYDLGNTGATFTALDFAEDNRRLDMAEYLRSKGARKSDESVEQSVGSMPFEHVISHLQVQFGPVQKTSLQEIVPTGMPIAINMIPPTERRQELTLFTTGMSAEPMIVPAGDEALQYAELIIHVPGDWQLDPNSIADSSWRWPIDWLRRIARMPHEQQTYLGGPYTILENGSPAEPLVEHLEFTAWLLAAMDEVAGANGRRIQLYTLVPLYPQEVRFERSEGLPALLRAFDDHRIKYAVDVERPSAV